MMLIIMLIIAVSGIFIIRLKRRKSTPLKRSLNPVYKDVIQEGIDFYKDLNPREKLEFEHRIAHFYF